MSEYRAEAIRPSRGRPRTSSRAMLQEAAFELFPIHGYAGTTVEQIARVAGVSRGTFFNNFSAKSDVFWVEIDESLERIIDALASLDTGAESADDRLGRIQALLLELATEYGPERVPWALTQHRLLGSAQELQASALSRFGRLASAITAALSRRGIGPAGAGDSGQRSPLQAQTIAFSTVGALVAAGLAWAEAGTGRGTLAPYLRDAFGTRGRG